PLVQLISLFAFYKLHNSYVNRSFLGGTNVRHFCFFPAPLPSKVYHTILYIRKECGLRRQNHSGHKPDQVENTPLENIQPFFFFREKRNKKTCPLPPQQKGVLLSC